MLAVEVDVRGRLSPEAGNVLVVANHISWLDIFVLDSILPVRFVAKAELGRWPIVSNLIRGSGTIFIVRERLRDAQRVNHQVAGVLAGGDVIAIFPEGTTTDGTMVLPFKGGLFQPIVEAEGVVQPIALRYFAPDGTHSLAPAYVGETSFATSFWRVCGEPRLRVEVTPTPALPARGVRRRQLTEASERAIRTALELPELAPAPGIRAGRQDAHP
jgi:1-acyl-sn-glycerol-3-phosphate acyltransferase